MYNYYALPTITPNPILMTKKAPFYFLNKGPFYEPIYVYETPAMKNHPIN